MHLGELHDRKFKGVLIDTNLLLLLLVGLFNKSLIKKFKRTIIFELDDFDKLERIIAYYGNCLYTTPNILTEITNLTDHEILNKDYTFFIFIHDFIDRFIEINNDSKTIIKNNKIGFIKLGLTDASILNSANEDILTLTVDLPLFQFLLSHSKPVINYNNYRFS